MPKGHHDPRESDSEEERRKDQRREKNREAAERHRTKLKEAIEEGKEFKEKYEKILPVIEELKNRVAALESMVFRDRPYFHSFGPEPAVQNTQPVPLRSVPQHYNGNAASDWAPQVNQQANGALVAWGNNDVYLGIQSMPNQFQDYREPPRGLPTQASSGSTCPVNSAPQAHYRPPSPVAHLLNGQTLQQPPINSSHGGSWTNSGPPATQHQYGQPGHQFQSNAGSWANDLHSVPSTQPNHQMANVGHAPNTTIDVGASIPKTHSTHPAHLHTGQPHLQPPHHTGQQGDYFNNGIPTSAPQAFQNYRQPVQHYVENPYSTTSNVTYASVPGVSEYPSTSGTLEPQLEDLQFLDDRPGGFDLDAYDVRRAQQGNDVDDLLSPELGVMSITPVPASKKQRF